MFVLVSFAPQVSQITLYHPKHTVACSEGKCSKRKLPFWPNDRARGPFELRSTGKFPCRIPHTHFFLSLLCPQGTQAALSDDAGSSHSGSPIFLSRGTTQRGPQEPKTEGNLNEERADCLYQGHIAGTRDYDALDIDSSHPPLQ